MKSMLIVALSILVITIFQNSIGSNDSYNVSLKSNKALLFLNYTTAFDNYYLNNNNQDGDVTNKIKLPAWLPVDSSIKMFINGGAGYVYMPSASGIFSVIMEKTNNSALIGFTYNNSIVTSTGKVAKPYFIPDGYIVYMR